jgi:hypothetical protein
MLSEVFICLVSLTLRIWMDHVWAWLWHTYQVLAHPTPYLPGLPGWNRESVSQGNPSSI